MILGTGSNAAFLERADRVQHWEGERHGEKNVIIDIEWGAFGDKGETRRGIKPCFGTAKSLGRKTFSPSFIARCDSLSSFRSLVAGTIDFIRTEHDKEVDNGSLLKRSFT